MPRPCSSRKVAYRRCDSAADRLAVGSSRISSSARLASARAIATSWRSAAASSAKSRDSGRFKPACSSMACACRCTAARERKKGSRRSAKRSSSSASATESPGMPTSSVDWCTVTTPAALASRGVRGEKGLPLKRICPPSGASTPERIFTKVDLPAPLAPISATISPASIVIDRSTSARVEPKERARAVACSKDMAQGGPAGRSPARRGNARQVFAEGRR